MDPEEQKAKDAALLATFGDVLAAGQATEAEAADQLAERYLTARNVNTAAGLADALQAAGNREALLRVAQRRLGNQLVLAALDLEAAATTRAQAREAELTAAYGLRPRRYGRLVNGDNAAEAMFRTVAPQVVAFINARAAAGGYKFRLTVAELTTNFIAEGGFYVLDGNMTAGIDGFEHLGADTFIDRYAQLRPWLHPSVQKERVTPATHTNEKGESVTSITDLSLAQAVYASAAMLAHAQAAVEKDTRSGPGGFAGLTDRQEAYFTTMYYNAGPGFGRKTLANQGRGAADRRWTGSDDHETNNRNAHFNATMRTSSFEYTRDVVLDHDQFRTGPNGQAAVDVRTQLDEQAAAAQRQIDGATEEIATFQAQLDARKVALGGAVAATTNDPQARLLRDSLVAAQRRLALGRETLQLVQQALAGEHLDEIAPRSP